MRKLTIEEKAKYNYRGKKVACLDIDGTVYMSSLLMKHYEMLIEANILPKSELLDAWNIDMKNEVLIYQTANEYKEMLKTITLGQAQQVARMLVNTIKLADLNPFVISEIERLKRENTEVVLISGSPKFIVKEFAKTLNVKGYGSIYETCQEGFFNGNIQGMWGEDHKAHLVEFLGLNQAKEIIAYGDTGGDLGLFKYAQKSFLIEPTKENEERILKVHPKIIIVR